EEGKEGQEGTERRKERREEDGSSCGKKIIFLPYRPLKRVKSGYPVSPFLFIPLIIPLHQGNFSELKINQGNGSNDHHYRIIDSETFDHLLLSGCGHAGPVR
ncbi:MAG: hypothetical protein WA974_14905, partial [Thermodesulfobacteriota bacterium]